MLLKKLVLLFLILGLTQLDSFAQSCKLGGAVVDEHGHPLIGATVQVLNKDLVATTDVNGLFDLEFECVERLEVKITFVGFTSLDTVITSKGNTRMSVVLGDKTENLCEVVITSDQHAGRSSTTQIEIDENFLKDNDQGTLIKTMEAIPGVQSINVGVGIAKPVLRGMSLNRVVVMGNGVRQEGQQWGADHGLEIDAFDAQSVEIIKGPATIKYGSGSAAGVINVTPSRILAVDSLTVDLSSVYKTNNEHIGFSGQIKFNKNLWFGRARFTLQDFGDYRVPADSFVYNTYQLPIYGERLKNTAGNEHNGALEIGKYGDWGITRFELSTYNLKAGIFPGAMGIPRSYDLLPDGDNRNVDLPYQDVHHHKLLNRTSFYSKDNNARLNITLGYQLNRRIEYSEPHSHGSSTPETNEALKLDLHTLNFRADAVSGNNKKVKHELGFESQWRENRVGGFEFLIPNYTSLDLGIYYLLSHKISTKWEWNAGARLGIFTISGEEALLFGTADSGQDGSVIRSPSFARNFINWSASTGVSYQPASKHDIKVNLNKSYRNPSIAELGSNGIHHGTFRHEKGNPNLGQEEGIHFDLAWTYTPSRISLNIASYTSYYRDFIYLKPTAFFSPLPEGGQLFEYTQNNAFYAGGELTIDYKPNLHWKISVGADYVFNQNLDTRLPLPFTPPGRAMAELRYKWYFPTWLEEFEILAGYRHVMAQNRVDRNEPATPQYNLLRAGIRGKFSFGKQKLFLRITAENLANTAYLNHLSRYRYLNIPEQGRNIVFGLDIPVGISLAKN